MAETSRRSTGRLEIDLEGRAPTGVLTGEDGRQFPFTGWTELASVIEQWREAARRAHAE